MQYIDDLFIFDLFLHLSKAKNKIHIGRISLFFLDKLKNIKSTKEGFLKLIILLKQTI